MGDRSGGTFRPTRPGRCPPRARTVAGPSRGRQRTTDSKTVVRDFVRAARFGGRMLRTADRRALVADIARAVQRP